MTTISQTVPRTERGGISVDASKIITRDNFRLWTGLMVILMVGETVMWEKLGIGEAIKQNSPDNQPRSGLVTTPHENFFAPSVAAATIENPTIDVLTLPSALPDRIEKAFSGENQMDTLLLWLTADPGSKSRNKTLEQVVSFDQAKIIITKHEIEVEKNPQLALAVEKVAQQAFPTLNKILQRAFDKTEFESHQYPNIFSHEGIDTNLLLTNAKGINGGTFSRDSGYPSYLYGPFGIGNFQKEKAISQIAMTGSHELAHKTAQYFIGNREPGNKGFEDAQHSFVDLWSGIAVRKMGVKVYPDLVPVSVLQVAEMSGQATLREIIRLGFRASFGDTKALKKIEQFYTAGSKKLDKTPCAFYACFNGYLVPPLASPDFLSIYDQEIEEWTR